MLKHKNKIIVCLSLIAVMLLAAWLYVFIVDYRNVAVRNIVPRYATLTEDCKIKVVISSEEVCSYEYRGVGYRISLLNRVKNGIILYHDSNKPNWYIRFFLFGKLIYGPQSFS